MRALNIRLTRWKEGLDQAMGATKKELLVAIPNALNTLGAVGKEKAIRDITQRYNINPALVFIAFKVQKATVLNLRVTLVVRGRPFNLSDFHPVQTPTGVEAEFIRGKKEFYPHAFLQTMPGTQVGGVHKGVFFRRKLGPRGRLRPQGNGQIYQRLPIKAVTKISVPNMFLTKEIAEPFRDWVGHAFYYHLNKELRSN